MANPVAVPEAAEEPDAGGLDAVDWALDQQTAAKTRAVKVRTARCEGQRRNKAIIDNLQPGCEEIIQGMTREKKASPLHAVSFVCR
jgi:hypothetical protein